MTPTVTGAVIAGALAVCWVAFGFWAFVLVALATLVGAGIGWIVDGRVDVRAIADALRGRRSSS
ncbi:hypothetical protein OED01_15565 [Microbacterium sp. M28]|uniref:DUF2273 domain-containing protein n=1 Tax=Microbacterium sp. M28 TaxID=2962064 RepID=UPI0021F44A62|nr:hypothetical protein [Microbacterium sp. M28]UYO96998.1 hypothetical protein OED01_15565 [Microbacterium sp. M28]